jgi:hypothetical protein
VSPVGIEPAALVYACSLDGREFLLAFESFELPLVLVDPGGVLY